MTTPRELQSGKLPVRDCCHGHRRAVPKQWYPTTGIISLGGLAVHQPSQHVYRIVVVKPSRMRCSPCMLCATHFRHNATTWPSHYEPGIKKGCGTCWPFLRWYVASTEGFSGSVVVLSIRCGPTGPSYQFLCPSVSGCNKPHVPPFAEARSVLLIYGHRRKCCARQCFRAGPVLPALLSPDSRKARQ